MGIFKDAKLAVVETSAAKAWQTGQPVFACRLNVGATDPGVSGEIPVWSEMIGAVEGLGWSLDKWSVASDSKGRPEAYLLFRR